MSLVIDSRKYSIYVRVLEGEADGPLVYIDARGHIHVGGGDPGPLKERLQTAVGQIEAGVAAFQTAVRSVAQQV